MRDESEETAVSTGRGRKAAAPATPLSADLSAALGAAGYRHRLAPVRVAEELYRTIRNLRDQGLLAKEVFERYADYWQLSSPEVAVPRTLIVVASPSLPVKVSFQMGSAPLEAVIPPAYVASAGGKHRLELLRSVLEPAGYSVGRVSIPVKLLAMRAGLARYGRNNLAYIQGMGSYARLDAFCTDADLGAEEYETKGSMLMSCCPPCRNCHHVCPTGCIPHDGTVIDAARCLTYVNENEGEWPEWMDARGHNSLVGCMRCQAMCPANRFYVRKEEVVAEFDREETEIILENRPTEQLPAPLRARLEELDLEEYSPVLGRNLLALRDAGGEAPVL